MFGHAAPEEPVEIVSYRVRGIGLVPPVELPKFERSRRPLAEAQRETRRVRFDGEDGRLPDLSARAARRRLTFTGPAILDQFDCTTVICPGQPRGRRLEEPDRDAGDDERPCQPPSTRSTSKW